MENSGRLIGQIAAEAGCTANKAKIGLYLMQLSESGATIARASLLLKRKPESVKRYAREFMIDFPDYRPFSRTEKKGECRPDPKISLDA